MDPIAPDEVRFIKLGQGGEWEKQCIEGKQPCIKFGWCNPYHKKCLQYDWSDLRSYWERKESKTKGKATEIINQIKDFYTLGENTLWITFYNKKLYWCFAEIDVVELPDKNRIRRTNGRWSCQDVLGNDLLTNKLSGKLTKIQGFRGTLCSVAEKEYLVRRINGVKSPEVDKACSSLSALEESLESLICSLSWKDFELLCDLIFARSGWQRVSELGKTEKSIDLDMLMPVTGKRACVQIKSRADRHIYDDCCRQLQDLKHYDEKFFIVHSPGRDFAKWRKSDNIEIWSAAKIAKLVIQSGLTDWLIEKNS